MGELFDLWCIVVGYDFIIVLIICDQICLLDQMFIKDYCGLYCGRLGLVGFLIFVYFDIFVQVYRIFYQRGLLLDICIVYVIFRVDLFLDGYEFFLNCFD